jgi:hypothetical protein
MMFLPDNTWQKTSVEFGNLRALVLLIGKWVFLHLTRLICLICLLRTFWISLNFYLFIFFLSFFFIFILTVLRSHSYLLLNP